MEEASRTFSTTQPKSFTQTMTNVKTPSPSPISPTQSDSTAGGAGSKRKRGGVVKYYAVKNGFRPGVYFNWSDCLAQVTGFKGAVFQSFPSIEEANAFLAGVKLPSNSEKASTGEPTKFYAIARGRVPGVYTDWSKAKEHIKGFPRPRFKRFSTRAEAEEFIRSSQPDGSSTGDGANGMQTKTLPGARGLTVDNPRDETGVEYPAGTGPLPPGAEDGFDPNVLLDPKTGKVVYKTQDQKRATKTKPPGPPGMLRIYTDGSSLRNGTNLASAGVGVYFGPADSRNVSEPLKGNRQTNQRAELTAILRALDIAPRHRDVTIVTDSRYAIDSVTVWFIKWQRNNWMTADGKPVENKDLVEPILIKIEERNLLKVKTVFEWVKGHNRDPGNEEADRLAVNGARRGVEEKSVALASGGT